MPHDIDHKVLRDLLSENSDSDSGSGIYEYAETSRELTCKYPTSSTRYTGSSTKKGYPSANVAYEDRYRVRQDTYTDRHKPRDYHQRSYQDRTDSDLSSLFQETTTNLFGRSFEEASFDFLRQIRPQLSRRPDGTPSLTSDKTRSGSSSSRHDSSPGPVRQRHRSPTRRGHQVISHVPESTPHVNDTREDAAVWLPSIRELDQSLNAVVSPNPPSPPGYASRREYEQRRIHQGPRAVSPESSSWHTGYPSGEYQQTVNNPIPRVVSPEPHSRPRCPTREFQRVNYPSSRVTTQEAPSTARYPIREHDERRPVQRVTTPDIHLTPRYPNRASNQRTNHSRTLNYPLDPPSPPAYPDRRPDQYPKARNVSPEPSSMSRTFRKQSEHRRNYSRNQVVSPEPSSPLYHDIEYEQRNDHSFTPVVSPESPSTPRAFNALLQERDKYPNSPIVLPEPALAPLYSDIQLDQETDYPIARLSSPDPSSSSRIVNRQVERRRDYPGTRVLLPGPPSSPLPPSLHSNVRPDRQNDYPDTRVISPALPARPVYAGSQPDQTVARDKTPAHASIHAIPNRETEHRVIHSIPSTTTPEPVSSPISRNRESGQEISLPTPRVVTPAPPTPPRYPDENAANIIESVPSVLALSEATRKTIFQNNQISEWDFSTVDVSPAAATAESITPVVPTSNKRKVPPPQAPKPPKVPKVPKQLKEPKTPKTSKPPKQPKTSEPPKAAKPVLRLPTPPPPVLRLPTSEDDDIDELAGDDDNDYIDQPAADPPSRESQKTTTTKKPIGPTSFKCEYCAKVFTRNFDKRRHIKSIHQEQTEHAIQSRTCPCCNEVLSRGDAFKRHIVKVPESCIRLAELRSMPLTVDQKKRLLKMHEDGIPPRFPFDELFYMYRR